MRRGREYSNNKYYKLCRKGGKRIPGQTASNLSINGKLIFSRRKKTRGFREKRKTEKNDSSDLADMEVRGRGTFSFIRFYIFTLINFFSSPNAAQKS